jgi:hypothetical protein
MFSFLFLIFEFEHQISFDFQASNKMHHIKGQHDMHKLFIFY